MGVFQNLGGDWRNLLGFRIYFKRAVACKNLVGPTLIFFTLNCQKKMMSAGISLWCQMHKVNFFSFDFQGPKPSLEGERQIRCRAYTSSVKCRIYRDAVVFQWRQRNFTKKCAARTESLFGFFLRLSQCCCRRRFLKLPTNWDDTVEPDVYMENRL